MERDTQGEELFNMMNNLSSHIEANTDHREKIAGDKVKVWDGSANVDNTGHSRHGIDPLFDEDAILVRTDCEKKMKKRGFLGVEDREEILDVELYFPKSEITVWTKMDFIQLADFKPLK